MVIGENVFTAAQLENVDISIDYGLSPDAYRTLHNRCAPLLSSNFMKLKLDVKAITWTDRQRATVWREGGALMSCRNEQIMHNNSIKMTQNVCSLFCSFTLVLFIFPVIFLLVFLQPVRLYNRSLINAETLISRLRSLPWRRHWRRA